MTRDTPEERLTRLADELEDEAARSPPHERPRLRWMAQVARFKAGVEDE